MEKFQRGVRKARVRKEFDAKGRDAARALAERLGLAPKTAGRWFYEWCGATLRKPRSRVRIQQAAE